MSDLFRSFAKVVLVFIVAGLIINDAGAYFYTKYQGQSTANTVANSFVMEYAKSNSITSAANNAQLTAKNLGANLISYRLNNQSPNAQSVDIIIELKIQKTVIINRIDALKNIAKVKVYATDELK